MVGFLDFCAPVGKCFVPPAFFILFFLSSVRRIGKNKAYLRAGSEDVSNDYIVLSGSLSWPVGYHYNINSIPYSYVFLLLQSCVFYYDTCYYAIQQSASSIFLAFFFVPLPWYEFFLGVTTAAAVMIFDI